MKVKEFINYQVAQDSAINTWLEEMGDTIEIVDIKYSVGVFQEERQESSGVLYSIKKNKSIRGIYERFNCKTILGR